MEAYDTQMHLITPDTRQIWLDEFESDPKKFDQKFIKINNVEELRRLLANKIYGTKPHLPKGHWEKPLL